MNEAIHELGQQLSSENAHERVSSAMELAELEDAEAVPFLVQALEDEEAPVRRWGAYGLAKLERPEHAPALRRALENDPDPRVRIQAAFGLVQLGERDALEKLPPYLGAPEQAVRREAAAMLVSLPDSAPVRPLLKPLLTGRDQRSQAWAAGLLHALGESGAFPKWLSALASAEARRDAVLAVPFMHEARAVRELLRLLAELPQEELDAAEDEESSLLVLLCEALRMCGLELLLDTDADEALRADLLVMLGRHRPFVPDLVDGIVDAFAQRAPDKLGRELAQLLSEREPAERGPFFTNVASLFPKAALPTLAELKGQDREALLRAVVQMAKAAEGMEPDLLAICETLRATPYGHHFEGLPTEPATREHEFPEGEDGVDGDTQEVALPEDDEASWTEQVPPDAEAVAQRALVLGGLLRRLLLEERLGKVKDPAAKEEILRLQRWMDEEGLFSTLGVADIELLEAEPGTWLPDHRQSVAWLAEELQWLLWALKQQKPPPFEARVETAPLL
ncbi:MAG: HEAT repeat domain-containing protein, partial [Hyalangium sp.]|uniref:HEAT repeat domain-containing protein n=1 Tax=Hyalangium sp. TaxID=2028555 RepID=UPI00389AADF6